MADLVVIVPSRGRPHAAAEIAQAFADTCTADTALWLAVDADDPTIGSYPRDVLVGNNSSMVSALNFTAHLAVREQPELPPYVHDTRPPLDPAPFALGFMGDDHRPRTVGWDQAYLDALRQLGTGIVYGNDLLQGERLPTQCAMTADIVGALGYMAPSGLTHLMVDNFWLDLGRAADCIRYLPEVVVEHVHPLTGKVGWDEGHVRVNDPTMYQRDRVAYTRFQAEGGLRDAVAKVRALRGAA